MSDVRLDRLATLHIGWPVSKMLVSTRGTRIPILMYHAVEEHISERRPYYETSVSPTVFADQLRQLRNQGYRAVGLQQAVRALEWDEQDEKLVAITFDDGFLDFYESAFPILSDCNFTASVFLITDCVDAAEAQFKQKKCLTWNQIRELQSAGINFGSHTATHPRLRNLDMSHVEAELASSKKSMEDHLGSPVDLFSYPYAFPEADHDFTQRLKDCLVKNGYEIGVTTILGTAEPMSDRLFLPRLPVNQWDDAALFQAKLDGGYDWLHGAQYLSKWVDRLRAAQS